MSTSLSFPHSLPRKNRRHVVPKDSRPQSTKTILSPYDSRGLDVQRVYETFGEDFIFLADIYELFVNTIPEDVFSIIHASSIDDHETVKSIAHKIRPSFGIAGFTDLESELKEIELSIIKGSPDKSALFDRVRNWVFGAIEAIRDAGTILPQLQSFA